MKEPVDKVTTEPGTTESDKKEDVQDDTQEVTEEDTEEVHIIDAGESVDELISKFTEIEDEYLAGIKYAEDEDVRDRTIKNYKRFIANIKLAMNIWRDNHPL
jgi:hypothetical protein